MIALIQRISQASVSVGQRTLCRAGKGMLALIGVQPADSANNAEALLRRLLSYRIFEDVAGKMNLSLRDISGDLLLVSQFTLAADTGKGLRPSFSSAAPPELAKTLYDHMVEHARKEYPHVHTGEFAANMQVHLINDGPVTFWLEN